MRSEDNSALRPAAQRLELKPTVTREQVITGLGGNVSTGMCKCPAHDDNTPSLSVGEGRDGKVLVKCFSEGCTQDRVISALRSRGLWGPATNGMKRQTQREQYHHRAQQEVDAYRKFKKGFLHLLKASVKGGQQSNVVDYLRNRGITIKPPACMRALGENEIVMPVVSADAELCGPLRGCHVIFLTRHRGKLIKQERRSFGPIKGGYVPLGDARKDQPLIVAEGVESTLAAMQVSGLAGIATLGTSGMQSVRVPACSEVIIAADSDKAGRNAARTLANRLEIEGRTVNIVYPQYRNEDWNDVVREDGSKAANIFKQQAARGRKTALARPAMWHFAEDFMQLAFPKREMLLAPWLPNPGIAMLYAKRGEAKTFLAMSIAFAVARGEDLLGWQCEKRGRVLYIDGEMPGSYLQERLSLFGKPPRGSVTIVSHETFNLRRERMPDLGTAEGRAVIDAIIDQVKPDLVTLDSLSTLIRMGEESSAEDWAPVQDWLMHHRWCGRTFLLIHHAGKSGTQRGTSKREDTPETVIKLTKVRDADNAKADESVYQLEFDKGRELFGLAEEPMLLRLAVRAGTVTWEHTAMRDARMEKVTEMLAAGMKLKDIAIEIGVSVGRVSQIAKVIRQSGERASAPNVVAFARKG